MSFRAVIGLVFIAGLIALGVLAWTRLESSAPALEGPEELLLGGEAQEIAISLTDDGMGLRRVSAELIDATGAHSLVAEEIPGTWMYGSTDHDREIVLQIDPNALKLADGDARIRVVAEDWSWRSNVGELEIPVEIDRVPPPVTIRSGLTYVDQGGAGAVVYELPEAVQRDGVEVVGANGTFFYPGFPHPASGPGADTDGSDPHQGLRVAIFGVERDAGADATIAVIATDRAGNESSASWNVVLKPNIFPRGTVNLPASFLRTVVPRLANKAGMDTSDPAAAFKKINTEMRRDNERTIRAKIADSEPRPLWTGAFQQLANSQVTSRFAEDRVYLVDGRPVSDAIHYGYDLASLAGADITAANAGIVRHAGDLGIYGNCVILDHGLGVASIYGHLSRIDVEVGDSVEKGQRLGLSGSTGLAGGDHLHFAMLVGPTYVDPVEWWDGKWVREHVDDALQR